MCKQFIYLHHSSKYIRLDCHKLKAKIVWMIIVIHSSSFILKIVRCRKCSTRFSVLRLVRFSVHNHNLFKALSFFTPKETDQRTMIHFTLLPPYNTYLNIFKTAKKCIIIIVWQAPSVSEETWSQTFSLPNHESPN